MTPPNFYLHPTAIVDEGAIVEEGVKIWHFCHVARDARIGARTVLGQNCFVASGVHLGADCRVQNNVSLYEGVICEDQVFLGPSMVFTNVVNPRSAVSRKNEFKKTVVRLGATIGANATIVCGVEIGSYAFIGAGAVVTRAVPPFALVVGNPARRIGFMSKRGVRLRFDDAGIATCAESGERYALRDGNVSVVEES
jgi:UDP-2-acetamido-3-amino-2,3-dideoxy-glucuronate N-acetyltransferase